MFILIRLTQHVSGIINPIIRRTDYVNNCMWSMPLLFVCLKNLRIYEIVKMNVRFYVSSFPIPATCTSTCIDSAVALQLVMFDFFHQI